MLPFMVTFCLSATVQAQGRTDVVTLANGDRITGEIVRLERGRLQFKTDDAGTLYLEWDKLATVIAAGRVVEALTVDGRRFLGTLGPSPDRTIAVVAAEGTTTLSMPDVILITPIGESFWRKLDGSIDLGFSYTKSSEIAQLNLNSDTIYRKPAFQVRLSASLTQTRQSEGDEGERSSDDRGSLDGAYLRYPWRRWFVAGGARFETNESLGLELRSQVGGAFGPRVINSNRSQLAIGAGLVVNDERGVDVEPTQNIEGFVTLRASYYTYDRPRTTVDVSLNYYPSLSSVGRHRVQLDAAFRREVWKDLFVTLNIYDTFDSRPPNPDAERNDVGIVLAVGWTY